MRYFVRRRIRSATLVLFALTLVWLLAGAQARSLGHAAFLTGYIMLAAIGFLALYNVRKKLPFLPLGSSTAWLQCHIYVAIGSLGVYLLHVGLKLPTGVLETSLAIMYLLTMASGCVGLYLTRAIPRQLARVGEQVIYERIPGLRREVWQRANEVALAGVAASGTTTLADYYAGRLFDFLALPRSLPYQLWPTMAGRRALLGELKNMRRYLTDQEHGALEELFALVRKKDDLDFHESRQKLLKLWLFAHIALTYTLLLLAGLHAVLTHAFHGGAV
jgi:hypothetical protein